MLSVGDPRPGYEGFISDFEFAKIPGTLLGVPQDRPGPAMTVSRRPLLLTAFLNRLREHFNIWPTKFSTNW